MTLREYLKSIADAIRSKLNLADWEKINAQQFPEAFDWVYDSGHTRGYEVGREEGYNEGFSMGKEEGYWDGYGEGLENGFGDGEASGIEIGKQAEYDAFWDAYQHSHGAPVSHNYTFASDSWTDESFKPKYDIVIGIGSSGANTFWGNQATNIAETLEKQGVRLDTTLCGFAGGMFQTAKTKRIPELNFTHAQDYSTNGLQYTFTNCLVETIDKIIVVENLKFHSTFQGCANLKNIVFEGVIGQAINFQWSTLLSHDSIVNIINTLSTTASGQTATFSKTAVNNAFTGGSDGSEWQTLIDTKKNWAFSLV